MNSTPGLWQRIPVLVRAVLTGLVVLFFGASVWLGILIGSRRLTVSVPWATGPVFLLFGFFFLWAYWRYLGGRGWPRLTAEARRERLRVHPLPGGVWAWALCAGVLAVTSYIALIFVWARLIHLQPYGSGFPRYSALTTLCLLLGASIEAGLVEEAAFRGYMQVPLEKRYGPAVAIVVVSLVFGAAHLANGYRELTWDLPYVLFGAILGTLAYLTNSLLPGVVLHAAGDAARFLLVWKLGPNPPKVLIWQSGPDASFWASLAVASAFGIAAVWAYGKLAVSARLEAKHS